MPRDEARASTQGVDEQHIVLQMNMLQQILAKFRQPTVQGTPCVAGTFRRADVVGQQAQARQRLAMLVMLHAHHLDRRTCLATHAPLQHREQHLFLLEHVPFKFLLHALQVVGQAIGALVMAAVNLFHAPGQADQLRQLLAVAIVVAGEDMGDQLGRVHQGSCSGCKGSQG